jgi:beta-phosphoglucomutase family hydrolase
MKETKGLIFDFDGTLVDTMHIHWQAWKSVTQRHKLHFTKDRFNALAGMPSQDILKILAEEQGRSIDHITVSHEKESIYIPLMTQAKPIQAVLEIALGNFGKVPMAIASGGPQESICDLLAHLKIRHLFMAVVSFEMVQKQKPAPDIFLEAARRIGIEPKFCRAYEDSDLGLRAIHAAGMEAVDVRSFNGGIA